jgi:hypothetical protein
MGFDRVIEFWSGYRVTQVNSNFLKKNQNDIVLVTKNSQGYNWFLTESY